MRLFRERQKCPRCDRRLPVELFTSSWCIGCAGKLMDNILTQIGSVVALSFVGRTDDAMENWRAARQWVKELPKDYSCGINLYALLDDIYPERSKGTE